MKKGLLNAFFLVGTIFSFASCGSSKTYTITWLDDNGTTLSVTNVKEGTLPVYDKGTPTKEPTVDTTYTFNGWSPEVIKATCDTSYTATYKASTRKYEVTFDADDGYFDNDPSKHTKSIWVEYNSMPVFTETPKKKGDAEYSYSFEKWDHEFEIVRGEQNYKASYTPTKNKYTVNWKNWDGSILFTEEVEYGSMPTEYTITPTKPSDYGYDYEFGKWMPEREIVTGPQTYIASFIENPKKFTITWMGGIDGTTEITTTEVEYGKMPEAPSNVPETLSDDNYDYTFLDKWSPTIIKVNGPATYVAQYSQAPKKFNIKWNNWNGTPLIETQSVSYGRMPVYSGDTPTKIINNHNFTWTGWDKEIVEAVEDTTYTATFDNDITFDFIGTNCVINEKSEFTDVYTFNDQNQIQYTITPINTYESPDEVTVSIDGIEVGDDKYSYDSSTGEFSIAANLGNIKLEAEGARV